MARQKVLSKGTLIQRGKSRVWYLRVSEGGSVQYVRMLTPEGKKAANRTEAEALAVAWLARGQLGDRAAQLRNVVTDLASVEEQAAALVEAARPRLPVADVWQKFETDKTRPQSGPRTLSDYKGIWQGYRRDRPGCRAKAPGGFLGWLAANRPEVKTVEDISPAVATDYMLHVEADGLSPRRFNAVRQALSLVVRSVTRSHAPAEIDPFKAIRQKPLETIGHRPLTLAELAAIFAAADGELKMLVAIGAATGFRLGDACLLAWSEVDMLQGQIVKTPAKTRRRVGKSVKIAMHPALVEMLGAVPPSARKGYVLPSIATQYQNEPASVCKSIRDLFKIAGIEDTRQERAEGKRAAALASFHSIRHAFVSELARRNVPLHEIRALVGHGSEAIQRVYLHAAPSDLRRAVAALPMPGDQAAPTDRQRLADLVGKLSDGAVVEVLAMVERLASLPSKN